MTIPVARPGWFELADTGINGLPESLCSITLPGKWKFWSPEATNFVSGAVRSFVTSSGTCSLDLGIPVFAKHPKIMMREIYSLPQPPVIAMIESVWEEYERLTHSRDDLAIRKFLLGLDLDKITLTNFQDEFVLHKEQEMIIDLTGKRRLLQKEENSLPLLNEHLIGTTLSQAANNEAVYVKGHPNPDADCIVTSVFEAIRRSKVYSERVCLPWCKSIPREVRKILSSQNTALLSKIKKPKRENDIVLVDCHQTTSDLQMSVRAIIDHHIIKKKFPYYVACSHEVSWSSTIQVYVKILGSGMDLAPEMARILLEATRLEAEPGLLEHMSEIDKIAIQRLESVASCAQDYAFHMSTMVDHAEAEELFYRDYRQTTYGFSVVKTKMSRDYYAIAVANNAKQSLPLTVVKEVTYSGGFEKVVLETILLVCNPAYHDKVFRDALSTVVTIACQRFHSVAAVTTSDGKIVIKDVLYQTPRLLLMPLLEGLVQEHLRFSFASSINKYVALGFYSGSHKVYGQPGGDAYVCTGLSYKDVKKLLQSSNQTTFLSLGDFWKVYSEMAVRGNRIAIHSLQHDQYVELLDTLILDGQTIKSGPNATVDVEIRSARPALIRPSDDHHATGIPLVLHSPDTYGDKSLWRYWSPDCSANVATRGHIFVMNQTSIDLKVRPEEVTQQLTFRPVYADIPDIKFRVELSSHNWVSVIVYPRLFSVYKP